MKDKQYVAKVGKNLYLQGKDTTSDPEEADVFESKTEPTQRINQMKRDGLLKKNVKPEIVELSERVHGTVEVEFFDLQSANEFKKEVEHRFRNRRDVSITSNFNIPSKVFESVLTEAKGYDNDERYSHSPEKHDLFTLRHLFLDIDKLTRYFWEHPDFTSTSCCGLLADAMEQSETLGYEEGFYPEASAAADKGTDIIFGLTDLLNPDEEITLYRGIELSGDAEPDTEHPGICWTYDKQAAIDFVSQFDDDDPNNAPCILTGKTKASNIDWLMSVLLLSDTPEEKELRIWDDSQIEIIDTEVL